MKDKLRRIAILRKIYDMCKRFYIIAFTPPKGRDFIFSIVPKHSVCAEIGVWKGAFSDEISRLSAPKKLHLIDPWRHEESPEYKLAFYGGKIECQGEVDEVYMGVLKRFKAETASGAISIHRKPSEEACQDFPDDYFDWIYIDGNHLYEFVKKDLENYYKKVKRGGYITGDDYTTEGWWKEGVRKAVDEIIATGLVKKVKIANGQFVLRKN